MAPRVVPPPSAHEAGGGGQPSSTKVRAAPSLAEPTTQRFEIVETTDRNRPVLVETSGFFAGRPHRVGTEGATVGRGSDCTLRCEDDALSRMHARVVRSGTEVVLEDLGSLNGSFVGDRRVSRQTLHDGDRVRFGPRFELRFHVVSEAEEQALVRLYESGLRDPLTGLPNRRQLDESLRVELSFARRHGTDLSLLVADIDRFKMVNDTYGHLVGDVVLRHVAQVLSTTVRVEDLVARFGGEEFVVIARSTGIAGAVQLAERLRVAVEGRVAQVEGRALRVTASFGVASLACVDEESAAALLARADERLYQAKERGRNRVVAAG
jgi:two-component system cell cycle response regulator